MDKVERFDISIRTDGVTEEWCKSEDVTEIESALEAAREELKKERIDSDVTLGKFRAALTKAEQGRDAAVKAIREMCKGCEIHDGISACLTELPCSLYPYRPDPGETDTGG